jgi:hypothetical protein
MKSLAAFAIGCIVGAAAFGAGVMFQRTRGAADSANFTEITVGRINVSEPDGTPRIIISNKSRFPGAFVEGKEIARPDRRQHAGMIFVNEEGTENGGFLQSGAVGEQGAANAVLSITFDRFRQDQTLQLLQAERDGRSRSGVIVNDRPDYRKFSIAQAIELIERTKQLPQAEREAALRPYAERGEFGNQRAYLGTTDTGDSTLSLRDARGRIRLRLLVAASGEPRIEILDAEGRVVRTLDERP